MELLMQDFDFDRLNVLYPKALSQLHPQTEVLIEDVNDILDPNLGCFVYHFSYHFQWSLKFKCQK